MEAIKTETTNATFVAEGCFDLPGTKYKYEDGTPVIETCWKLSDEDIEEITKNRCVFICMLGETVPPMRVDVRSELKRTVNKNDFE